MGYTPREIDDMSIWQFAAAVVGFAKQHEEAGMTDKEADNLWDWLQTKDDVPLAFTKH
jgi:hypothetical protein